VCTTITVGKTPAALQRVFKCVLNSHKSEMQSEFNISQTGAVILDDWPAFSYIEQDNEHEKYNFVDRFELK
jgi:hypothetical protein